MPADVGGATTLTRDECLALLGSVTVGRVALSVDALPVILPVAFCMDGDRVVFGLDPSGTVIGGRAVGERGIEALDGAIVAFEADALGSGYGDGWSVLVRGAARCLTSPEDLDRCRTLPVAATPGDRPRYVEVSTSVVEGQRVDPVHLI
jgi:uncharacterized protein